MTPMAVTASVRVNDVTAGGQHLPTVTVGPAGQVYVAWVDCPADQECTTVNPDIYLARSTDGGQHFSARVLVSDDGPGAYANAPRIATSAGGTIYVVWHDDRATTPSDQSWDVYLSRSTDGGLTFSPSVRVNEHVANAYQYEPDLAVGPDGTIYASWQRYAYDGTLGQWDSDVYAARSTDG
ncbi:MAG TPA: sialidase family protein, partial [Vicinamibacteria bacterium]